ncbi:hypothetical protein [Hymenobacter rubripertinctus]|uniref:hypothetical protein n=1 Tax=Hymenobacter rubripertinctus TaxID=2029981 RepID=UPI0011C48471|nr:hypothetical protein [Hymenobacter rubripertinctus]
MEEAKKVGFISYTEFPDINTLYTDGVLEIFARRLTRNERNDRSNMLEFWSAEGKGYDAFDMLAMTQGWLTTDNFEFLADFYPKRHFQFVTDLAYTRSLELPRGTIAEGDKLQFKFDRKNEVDCKAIRVFKDELFIGFIKQKHCNFFHHLKRSWTTNLQVKAVDQNGVIRQVFITVGDM